MTLGSCPSCGLLALAHDREGRAVCHLALTRPRHVTEAGRVAFVAYARAWEAA